MSYFSVSTTPEFLLEEVHQKGIATIRFFDAQVTWEQTGHFLDVVEFNLA